jgi:hypothetical protein
VEAPADARGGIHQAESAGLRERRVSRAVLSIRVVLQTVHRSRRGSLPAFWKVIPRGGPASAFNYTPDASAKTDTIVHYAATIWPRARARLLGGSLVKLPTCTRRS